MKQYEFDAEILKHEGIDGAYIDFPYDVETEFGVKGQVKVEVTFDGYPYRGSLAKMGHGCHRLGLTKQVRQAIGKQPGDKVHVVLKEDLQPRVVEVPEDFAALLQSYEEAKRFFDTLSYTNQKRYVQWVTDAKRAETREKRIHEAIRLLLDKVKQI